MARISTDLPVPDAPTKPKNLAAIDIKLELIEHNLRPAEADGHVPRPKGRPPLRPSRRSDLLAAGVHLP